VFLFRQDFLRARVKLRPLIPLINAPHASRTATTLPKAKVYSQVRTLCISQRLFRATVAVSEAMTVPASVTACCEFLFFGGASGVACAIAVMGKMTNRLARSQVAMPPMKERPSLGSRR